MWHPAPRLVGSIAEGAAKWLQTLASPITCPGNPSVPNTASSLPGSPQRHLAHSPGCLWHPTQVVVVVAKLCYPQLLAEELVGPGMCSLWWADLHPLPFQLLLSCDPFKFHIRPFVLSVTFDCLFLFCLWFGFFFFSSVSIFLFNFSFVFLPLLLSSSAWVPVLLYASELCYHLFWVSVILNGSP